MESINLDDIKRLVGLQLGKRSVKDSDRFFEDLGAESADVAILVAAVESKYGVAIKESEIARLFTPLDLYTILLQKISSSGDILSG